VYIAFFEAGLLRECLICWQSSPAIAAENITQVEGGMALIGRRHERDFRDDRTSKATSLQ
jgi:hypothetical protein